MRTRNKARRLKTTRPARGILRSRESRNDARAHAVSRGTIAPRIRLIGTDSRRGVNYGANDKTRVFRSSRCARMRTHAIIEEIRPFRRRTANVHARARVYTERLGRIREILRSRIWRELPRTRTR